VRTFLVWWLVLGGGLLAQSTLLPMFLSDPWRPDITRSLVLWAALTGVPRGGAALAFVAGLFLDVVSGAPPGFGAALRLGLYGVARPFRGVFFDDHPALLLPVALIACVADALGAWIVSWLTLSSPFSASAVFSVAWRQSLAEAIAVPLVFLTLEVLSGRRPPEPIRRGLPGGISL
jgi:rod shape-determining protein MreD